MKKIRLCIIIFVTILLCSCNVNENAIPIESEQSAVTDNTVEKNNDIVSEESNIRVFNVGQGLSILFQSDKNHNILYDGGGRNSSSYLVSRLKKLGIDRIDYIVASHYDEDHIAGLVGVIHTFEVENVICPDYETDTKIYQSFISEINSNSVNVIYPVLGEQYIDGSITMNILSADNKAVEDNDRSIAIQFVDNTFSMIVTGDCSAEKEKEIIDNFNDLDCDIYVAAHHGSKYSSSEAFLENIKPEYAIISCGKDNSYGHPHDEVLERLNLCGAKIYRTDQQGEIVIDISENDYIISVHDEEVSKNEKITNVQSDEQKKYVLNINTRKIHKPDCSSVSDILEKNIEYSSKSIIELENEGYEKCKRCFAKENK